MLRQSLLRRPLTPFLHQSRRYASDSTSRFQRFESRLPRFLQRLVTPLRTAPVSHITSFLLLHEITAVIPLFGLAGAFHYYNWLPPYLAEGKWVKEYTEKFGQYARKKGWLKEQTRKEKWAGRGEGVVRWVVEFATAWAVVKMFMPLRLVLSVWLTPWFARLTVLPLMGWFGRFYGRKKGGEVATIRGGATVGRVGPAGGSGAVGGGVLPKGPVK